MAAPGLNPGVVPAIHVFHCDGPTFTLKETETTLMLKMIPDAAAPSNVPVLVLLGFAAWTLLTLFGSIGVYRWSRILTGRASLAEWRADIPQGSDCYQRAMRAHM